MSKAPTDLRTFGDACDPANRASAETATSGQLRFQASGDCKYVEHAGSVLSYGVLLFPAGTKSERKAVCVRNLFNKLA